MDEMEKISTTQVEDLLEYFTRYTFQANDNETQAGIIEEICFTLFQQDYVCSVILNSNGELCSNYPTRIVYLEYEKAKPPMDKAIGGDQAYQSSIDVNQLRGQFMKAKSARCRTRFPIPVLLYEGKHVCRSSTLSGGPEIFGRKGIDFLFSGTDKLSDDEVTGEDKSSGLAMCDQVRNQDIKLLNRLNIKHICDLMVENKKVKYGMCVTSSEKVDKQKRYADFNLVSMPYPGCEFFRTFRNSNYTAEGLRFDWNQSYIDTNIVVPIDPIAVQLGIDWLRYKTWDLVCLTQNYFRLILHYVTEGSSGVLIHCISGWDRTPLFVSLLRISLWADGKIHQSLGTNEILYLTLAYDWFLCGHRLKDRLDKGEDILYFCFHFLKYIVTDEYSVIKRGFDIITNKMEGIVDESDGEHRRSVCGSNTSLSSNCSSLSCRSQDNPPTLFTNADMDSLEELNHPNLGNNNHYRPFAGTGSDGAGLNNAQSTHSSTSPMAVPAKVRKRSDSGSSAISSGSWQIITGAGSIRGSASTNDSWHNSSSEASSHSRHSQTNLCDIHESEASLDSSTATVRACSRHERLNAVRSLFHSLYWKSTRIRGSGDASSGMLATATTLIDQFAEKVGIRSGSSGTNSKTT